MENGKERGKERLVIDCVEVRYALCGDSGRWSKRRGWCARFATESNRVKSSLVFFRWCRGARAVLHSTLSSPLTSSWSSDRWSSTGHEKIFRRSLSLFSNFDRRPFRISLARERWIFPREISIRGNYFELEGRRWRPWWVSAASSDVYARSPLSRFLRTSTNWCWASCDGTEIDRERRTNDTRGNEFRK